jgi:hypothetical protein
VFRICIAPNNPSPGPGLNSRPLGPAASTLPTTPPRRHPMAVVRVFLLIACCVEYRS